MAILSLWRNYVPLHYFGAPSSVLLAGPHNSRVAGDLSYRTGSPFWVIVFSLGTAPTCDSGESTNYRLTNLGSLCVAWTSRVSLSMGIVQVLKVLQWSSMVALS